MSITVKLNEIKLKDQNGTYQSPITFADQSTANHIDEVNAAITEKGEEVLDSIPADYTDLTEEVSDLKSQFDRDIGTNVPIETTLEYTTVDYSYFRNGSTYSTIADAIQSSSNQAWRYGYCAATPGTKYRCTFYLNATTANRMWIMFGDSNGNWLGAPYREAADATSGLVTVDVTAPENAANIYVSSYTSAANQPSRLIIKELSYVSAFDQIGSIKNDISNLQENAMETDKLFRLFTKDIYFDHAFTLGRLNDENGGISSSNVKGVHSNVISIFSPVKITVPDGYGLCVNQYNNMMNISTTRFIRNIASYSNGAETCVAIADSYPAYIAVGVEHGGADMDSSDITVIENGISILSADEQPGYASISMFPSWAITGCSWDAGSIYGTNDGHVSHVGLGWAENVSRRNGMTLKNYGIGATSIRTWFNYENGADDAYSYKQLLEDNASPLYVLIFGGTNDRNNQIGFVVNDDNYSAQTPSTTTYYVGTLADITLRSSQGYTSYPCTFYGYYGRIIEMVKAHAPKSFIIVSSPNTEYAGNAINTALNTACKEIAEYYELPYMDITKDPYYPVYIHELVQNHPTAPTYSGWAMAFERLFARCVQENAEYFNKWGGSVSTTPVTWEKVELP